jgi:CHC2 zinc finger/Phage integrase family
MPQSRAVASSSRSEQSRVDTEWLRLQNPIVDLVARYGVELRRSGSHFTGRCPFHADGGRPNLVVFPRSGRWVCFRCDARGDAIAFVQRIENISFRDAASRLGGALAPGPVALTRHRLKTARHRAVRPIDTEVLAAAIQLYSNRLMTDGCALDYMAGRGFCRQLLEQERIGFAASGELVPYLAWRGVSSHRARRAGLLDAHGREVMEGRIVFPELRPHDLRHTHASVLLRLRTPMKVVQERLGHSSFAVTADIYSHVAPDLQSQAAGEFGAVLHSPRASSAGDSESDHSGRLKR